MIVIVAWNVGFYPVCGFFIMECNVDQCMCMRAPGSKTNFPIGDNKSVLN